MSQSAQFLKDKGIRLGNFPNIGSVYAGYTEVYFILADTTGTIHSCTKIMLDNEGRFADKEVVKSALKVADACGYVIEVRAHPNKAASG